MCCGGFHISIMEEIARRHVCSFVFLNEICCEERMEVLMTLDNDIDQSARLNKPSGRIVAVGPSRAPFSIHRNTTNNYTRE